MYFILFISSLFEADYNFYESLGYNGNFSKITVPYIIPFLLRNRRQQIELVNYARNSIIIIISLLYHSRV